MSTPLILAVYVIGWIVSYTLITHVWWDPTSFTGWRSDYRARAAWWAMGSWLTIVGGLILIALFWACLAVEYITRLPRRWISRGVLFSLKLLEPKDPWIKNPWEAKD